MTTADLDSPHSQEVASALRLLGHCGQELKATWEQRQQRLQEGLQLHRFGQEVDSFIATCANHEAFLCLENLGVWNQGYGTGLRGYQSPVTGGSSSPWVQKPGWAGDPWGHGE